MTTLSRLQELVSLTEAADAKKPATRNVGKDFNGIRSVVEDSLADLKDKLGKGGNLATLFKDSGASKLDTVKDSSGKNIMTQIVALTTEYTKAVEKLMMEAEVLVMQVSEGQDTEGEVLSEGLLTEGRGYNDSAEFTDEFYGMSADIEKLKSKMKNPRWVGWFKETDSNFGTDSLPSAREAISSINGLASSFSSLEEQLDQADNS